MSKSAYYDIRDDLEKHPECWAYLIVGGRNTGKTYGALKYYLDENLPNIFVKRTNEDVDTICAGNQIGKKGAEYEADFSPYKALNRDLHTSIKAFKIKNGIGGFYKTNDEGGAYGAPIAYLISLFSVSRIKGFDLSEADAIIFDEFIPQPWERINRKEGEQLMDLYKTVSRDRVLRGKGELKLICLANAVNVYNPTCEVLEVTDTISQMAASGRETFIDEEKGIFIRMLKTSEEMMKAEEQTGIYRAMKNTSWGRMAFGNEFGYNDFSRIKKVALKGYRPMYSYTHKERTVYIYMNDEGFYVTSSAAQNLQNYDLNTETGQKAFYYDHVIDLQNAAIDGQVWFEKYTFYDLIMNYKKRFII